MNMTEMIKQSLMSIAKQTKTQKKSKLSSHTIALMKKRREMTENKTPGATYNMWRYHNVRPLKRK